MKCPSCLVEADFWVNVPHKEFCPYRPNARDMYADGERRYFNDPAFKAAVDMLFDLGITQGYTPGELKQIAFMAALKAEQYATARPSYVVSGPLA